MKLISISLLTLFITAFTACKKENVSVEGKWQEVRMRRYNQDIKTGAISDDTIYQANTFGIYDYAQFNSNGTCVLSATQEIGTASGLVTKVPDKQDYTYTKSGSGFALMSASNSSLISGVSTGYMVSGVSSNNLTIQSVTGYLNPSVPYKTIAICYYTK